MIMKKKILSAALSAVMVFTMSAAFPYAAETASAAAVDTSGDSRIPENVAEIIAQRFVQDLSDEDLDMEWTDDTQVGECTVLYDEDGGVSGYSFDLETDGDDSGYVVISAYTDIENQILEYSDVCDPLYERLNPDGDDKVIYTGTLEYFKDTGGSHVMSLDNTMVAKSSLESDFEACRSVSRQRDNLMEVDRILNGGDYVTADSSAEAGGTASDRFDIDGTIDDAVAYANANYAGPFSAYEWNNHLEQYCHYRITGNFPGYDNHCAPTAITNLLEMRGAYEGNSEVTGQSYRTIFSEVADYGIENGYYSQSGGSPHHTLNDYIEGSFDLFGMDVTVTEKTASYNNVKQEIENSRPFYLSLMQGNGTAYTENGGHGVVGYAYTRLQSETTGNYKSFLKVEDGWNISGRYIDLAMTASTSDAVMRAIS